MKTLDPDPDWYSAKNAVSGINESRYETLDNTLKNGLRHTCGIFSAFFFKDRLVRTVHGFKKFQRPKSFGL
jgi:hypothetical protein